MQIFRDDVNSKVYFNRYLVPKNCVDNEINRPQYLESVILLAQNVGGDLQSCWALRYDVEGKIVQEEMMPAKKKAKKKKH